MGWKVRGPRLWVGSLPKVGPCVESYLSQVGHESWCVLVPAPPVLVGRSGGANCYNWEHRCWRTDCSRSCKGGTIGSRLNGQRATENGARTMKESAAATEYCAEMSRRRWKGIPECSTYAPRRRICPACHRYRLNAMKMIKKLSRPGEQDQHGKQDRVFNYHPPNSLRRQSWG